MAKKKFHTSLSGLRAVFTGRGLFLFLATVFLAITVVFVVNHFVFIFKEIDRGFSREAVEGELPTFDIEGFQKLNLIKQ